MMAETDAKKSVSKRQLAESIAQNLASGIEKQRMCHMRHSDEPLPQPAVVSEIVQLCRQLIFPGFFGNDCINSDTAKSCITEKCERLHALLEEQILAGFLLINACCDGIATATEQAHHIASDFLSALPRLRHVLETDVEALYLGDPAASSYEEVIYCYPGIKAIINYRMAHHLLLAGVPVIPRMISELAHSETGIDIHPGATIGHHFAIDHGTGVVIGATAIIGNHVKIYQGVTLGARSFDTDANGNPIKGVPRHPIIGDNVIIYSNATILGRINIGNNVTIGGNIWVTEDIADGQRVVQAKASNFLKK